MKTYFHSEGGDALCRCPLGLSWLGATLVASAATVAGWLGTRLSSLIVFASAFRAFLTDPYN